jgi:two-component system response regulator WspF
MRIGIVNSNLLAAEAIRRAIARSGKHDVAWIARDGVEAVARCKRDRPELVLMDLFLPSLDGVGATHRIMAHSPCAIVVVTAKIENHMGKVFEAMGAGAIDAVSLPDIADAASLESAKPLLAKIETIRRLLGSDQQPVSPPAPKRSRPCGLVAIGASAGGPTALATILAALPARFPAAVVIVQHLDKQFAPGLTAWFSTHTKLGVRVAQEGDRVAPGTAYLAGRNQHLILSNPTQLGYSAQPGNAPYCPSVDVFFQSVARQWPGEVAGVLLTGMGRDGAEGLKTLRRAGHHTIAQDKSTSAVYGMPKAAAALEAANEILGLDKIGPRLTNMFRLK